MRTKTLAEKRRTLLWTKTTAETRKYFMLTRTLAEKGWLLLLPKPVPKKDKPILKTHKANHEHCKKKRHSQSKPTQTETQAKNLEADFSDSTKPTWTYASEETTAKQKRRELENLLAEKILTNTLLWKVPPLKTNWLYELKTTTPKKNTLAKKETCESKTYLVLLLGWLTVCVTRAGAGGGTPSDWENAEA